VSKDEEEDEHLVGFAKVVADEMERRHRADKLKIRRQPELHWIRWVAVGMAVANSTFAKKLNDSVDLERAFGGEEESTAAYHAVLLAYGKDRINLDGLAEVLGIVLRDGEKLSDAILRILVNEDREVWDSRNDRAMALYREASAALSKLMTIARGKSPQKIMAEGEFDDAN